jgi:hypothetical protein
MQPSNSLIKICMSSRAKEGQLLLFVATGQTIDSNLNRVMLYKEVRNILFSHAFCIKVNTLVSFSTITVPANCHHHH